MQHKYFLYVKIHKDTGLKYLGHTRSPNPYNYKGSGLYWKSHIQKYGYNVRTIILLETYDTNKLESVARFFSDFFDVVNSEKWANIIPETGNNINGVNETGKNLYGHNGKTPNVKDNLDRGRATQKHLAATDTEWVKNRSKNISKAVKKHYEENGFHWQGRKHRPESIEKQKQTLKNINHQQGSKNSQFGTMWIYSLEEQKCKKIAKGSEIPKGWFKGRKMSF